jgi:hypothetical protein
MDNTKDLSDSRVTDWLSTHVVDSPSFPDAEGHTISTGAGLFAPLVDNRHRFRNDGRRNCRTFSQCFDQQQPNSPAGQRHVMRYSGVGIDLTTATEIAEPSVRSENLSGSLELDDFRETGQAKQLDQLKMLEAHCGRLEAELYQAQVALVKQQVRIMEDTVEREDLTRQPCCPIVTCKHDRLSLPPRQGPDVAVCSLTSQTAIPTAATIVCSIPRKRRCPEPSPSNIGPDYKRTRYS